MSKVAAGNLFTNRLSQFVLGLVLSVLKELKNQRNLLTSSQYYFQPKKGAKAPQMLNCWGHQIGQGGRDPLIFNINRGIYLCNLQNKKILIVGKIVSIGYQPVKIGRKNL